MAIEPTASLGYRRPLQARLYERYNSGWDLRRQEVDQALGQGWLGISLIDHLMRPFGTDEVLRRYEDHQ